MKVHTAAISTILLALVVESAAAQGPDSSAFRSVNVNGHRVRVLSRDLESPEKGPVVVFEGGSSTPIEAWTRVLQELGDSVPFFTYDPPGLGGSDWDGVHPRPERVSQRLRTLLRAAGARPPFILVGHSWDGWNIRAFEAQYGDEVAGMVLIDPTPPVAEFSGALTETGAGEEAFLEFVRLGERLTAGAPEPVRARQAIISEYYETRSDPDVPEAPSVPVVVLVAGRYDSVELPESLRPAFDLQGFFHALRQRQTVSPMQWVSAAPNGILIYAADAAHCIHCTHADLVAWAIRRVIADSAGRLFR